MLNVCAWYAGNPCTLSETALDLTGCLVSSTLHVQGGFQAGSFTPLYGSPQKAVYQPSPANSTTYRHVPAMRRLLIACRQEGHAGACASLALPYIVSQCIAL